MKCQKEKLLCDTLAEECYEWFDCFKGVVDQKQVVLEAAAGAKQNACSRGIFIDDSKIEETLLTDENLGQTQLITCVINWYWCGRQVYRFDKSLSELLNKQRKEDIIVSADTLNHLPVDSFFVQLENESFFFSKVGNNVYFADYDSSGYKTCAFKVKDKLPISELIGLPMSMKPINPNSKRAKEILKEHSAIISRLMQFVVYLSVENAEIEGKTRGAIVNRQAGSRKYTVRDKTEISEVGYKLGSKIRKYQENKENVRYIGEHKKGSKKTPHIRQSHFHDYWVGTGEDKHLVTKYVLDIFVNANSADELDSSTVHYVE